MKKGLILLATILIVVCLGLEAASQQEPTSSSQKQPSTGQQPTPAPQQPPAGQKPPLSTEQTGIKKDVPIIIKADRMSGDRKSGIVVFEGNVVATQENSVLISQKLTTYFTSDQKISMIVAEGNVNFVQGERKGHCDKATDYYKERKLVFEGNPVFIAGKDVVSGARIEYDMNTEKAVVYSDQTRRVEAVIFPEQEENKSGSTSHTESDQSVSGPQGGGSGQH